MLLSPSVQSSLLPFITFDKLWLLLQEEKKEPLRTPFPYVAPCWLHHCRHWTLGLSSTLENERWREEKKAEGLARKKSSHVAKTFRALFLSAPESSWALISGDDTSWRQSAVVTGALRSRLSLKYWREFWWLSSSPTPPPILSLTSLLLWHSPLPRCVPPSTNPTTTRTPTKVSTSPFLLLRQLPSTTNGAASAKSNPTHSPWDLIPALFLLLFHSATLSLPFSPSLPLSPSLSLLLLSPFSFFFFHPSFRFWIPRAQPLPFSLISLSLSPSPSLASLDPLFPPPRPPSVSLSLSSSPLSFRQRSRCFFTPWSFYRLGDSRSQAGERDFAKCRCIHHLYVRSARRRCARGGRSREEGDPFRDPNFPNACSMGLLQFQSVEKLIFNIDMWYNIIGLAIK